MSIRKDLYGLCPHLQDTVQVTASNVELSGEEFAKISKDTIEVCLVVCEAGYE